MSHQGCRPRSANVSSPKSWVRRHPTARRRPARHLARSVIRGARHLPAGAASIDPRHPSVPQRRSLPVSCLDAHGSSRLYRANHAGSRALARRTSPRVTTSIFSTMGECNGKVRSTPTAVGNLANGVGLTGSGTGAGNHDALEHLHTGLVAFDDLHVNLHGVAGAEFGNVVAQRGGVDGIEVFIVASLPASATSRPRLCGVEPSSCVPCGRRRTGRPSVPHPPRTPANGRLGQGEARSALGVGEVGAPGTRSFLGLLSAPCVDPHDHRTAASGTSGPARWAVWWTGPSRAAIVDLC